MTKRDKLRRKIRNNPKNVKFSDIETLLQRFGFVHARTTGSHHIFVEDTHQVTVVIPVHGNHVKVDYVKAVMEVLDRVFPEAEQEIDNEAEGEDTENDQDA